MKLNLSYRILIVSLAFFACNKNDTKPDPLPTNCYVIKTIRTNDSFPLDTSYFFYNANHQLIKSKRKSVSTSSGLSEETHSYTYDVNNNMIKHVYSTPTFLNDNPYYKADYTYAANNILTSSKGFLYFLGVDWDQMTYTYDTAGRLTKVVLKGLHAYTGNSTTFYEYDNNSNLTKIITGGPGTAPYVTKEFFNYDNKPNPFYKFPWEWETGIHTYGDYQKLSKNNYGRLVEYGGANAILHDYYYTYEYDSFGKIIKITEQDKANSYSSVRTKFLFYECF